MEKLALAKVYRYIEPGPVMMVSTLVEGRPNLMTMSITIVIDDNDPPLIGCGIGPWDYSYAGLRSSGECVLAIPTVELMEKVVEIGNCSGRDVDKFSQYGLTPAPAEKVDAPLVAECLVNLECRVAETSLVEKYNLFIVKVVQAWIDTQHQERRFFHHNGDGTFTVDGETIDLKAKMGKWPSYIA